MKFIDPIHKLIALYYGIFAVLGLFLLAQSFYDQGFNFIALPFFCLLFAQLLLTIFAAYYYWQSDARGLILMYWISLSLVFIVFTPLIAYMSNIGVMFAPFIQLTNYASQLGFEFHISYKSNLRILNGNIWTLGINLIELGLFLHFRRLVKQQQISVNLKQLKSIFKD
ncbi:hypothetical protein EC844_10662 [Acinetobacter calcoaceticus]|uniref:Uncharacterized protein n=1 Tax=Acinetobacter calcoaceticus TaxID=471 RepID=A0A4R1XZH8_ACICA|nr:hypothetical protein EC844_10662 [Acinetobacter calcoaceticus]